MTPRRFSQLAQGHRSFYKPSEGSGVDNGTVPETVVRPKGKQTLDYILGVMGMFSGGAG